MIYAVANRFFYDSLKLNLPTEVEEIIQQTLSIYKEYYDLSIPFQSGGYILIITDKAEYQAVLEQLNTSSDMAEYSETIVESHHWEWKQEYYQLATEFGVSIIFYEPKGEINHV